MRAWLIVLVALFSAVLGGAADWAEVWVSE
jgi:membrane protein YqaA with SNARE-associated domain